MAGVLGWLELTARRDVHAAHVDVIAPDFRYPMRGPPVPGAALCPPGPLRRGRGVVREVSRGRRREGARPLRAIVDFDEALMYHRRGEKGDRELETPLLEAALTQFRELGMTGWIQRAEGLQKA